MKKTIALLALAFVFALPDFGQAADPAKMKAAITYLEKSGIITDADYWIENAKAGSSIEGEKVAALIINTVSKKQKVSTIDEACDYMEKRGTLKRTDYWRKNAREGSKCTGAQTAALITRMEALAKASK